MGVENKKLKSSLGGWLLSLSVVRPYEPGTEMENALKIITIPNEAHMICLTILPSGQGTHLAVQKI
jgi:hypothetical protein